MSDDIQKNEDIKGGQIAQTVQGNQVQINSTYLSIPSKSLKDYDKDTVTIEYEDGETMTFDKADIALIRLAFDF